MPLAYEMRPQNIDEFIGQEKVVGESSWLRNAILKDQISSIILFGPPGTGKTTLAHIVANQTKSNFVKINAVLGTVKILREELVKAEKLNQEKIKTIIFVDEIHRFNKAQQDVLLPYVENGSITLIGATTENPSFTVISPLISRSKVLVLERLANEDLEKILDRAVKKLDGIKIDKKSKEILIQESNGDARILLNSLEDLYSQNKKIDSNLIKNANVFKTLKYDRNGEEHYNIISALHKSMRDSDPDGSVYWMMRMVEAGENPLYIARRLIRFASEDIGMADPHALLVAEAAYSSCHYIGLPECDVILAQATIHLALAPKSNACYKAVLEARSDIRRLGNLDVPNNLRNASTKLMKEIGYGKGYKYAHDYKGAKVSQQHLPEKLKSKKYYYPSDRGLEAKIKERIESNGSN